MVTNPKVLLLDEPLSAIDALLRHSLQVEIRRIQQELNMTAIFVTHDQDEAMVMSDVIHLMYNGKIEQSATPTEMYTEPVSKFAATFIGHYNMVPVDAFKKMTGVDGEGTDVAFRPEVIDISTKPVEREGCATIKGHVVVSLPHGNVLRYAVMCGDHQIDVDVLFKKATIIPNGTDVYLTLKQDDLYFPLELNLKSLLQSTQNRFWHCSCENTRRLQMEERNAAIQLHRQRVGEEEQRDRRPIGLPVSLRFLCWTVENVFTAAVFM